MKQGRSAFASSGESLPDLGDVEGGIHEYGDEDILGQAVYKGGKVWQTNK